jgi:hypothetical protein
MQPNGTFVDPRVSRSKFDREVAAYREREEEHQRRGWWMLKAEFPEVFVVFGAPKSKPALVMFGAMLDFRNYDLWPPSVALADPFTRTPYKAKDLPHKLLRQITTLIPNNGGTGPAVERAELTALMQDWGPETWPFLCLPGVREYHDNVGHSGDSWLMHRRGGEGTLHFILEQLFRFGAAPIRGVQFQHIVQQVGFAVEGFPT